MGAVLCPAFGEMAGRGALVLSLLPLLLALAPGLGEEGVCRGAGLTPHELGEGEEEELAGGWPAVHTFLLPDSAPGLFLFSVHALCSGGGGEALVSVSVRGSEGEDEGYRLQGCSPEDPGFPQAPSWPVAVAAGECLVVAVGEGGSFAGAVRALAVGGRGDAAHAGLVYGATLDTAARVLLGFGQRGYCHVALGPAPPGASLGLAVGCSFARLPDASLAPADASSAYMFVDAGTEDNCLLLSYETTDESVGVNVTAEFIPSLLDTRDRLTHYSSDQGEIKNMYQGVRGWEAFRFSLGSPGLVRLTLTSLNLGEDGMLVYKTNTCNPGYMGTPTIWRQEDVAEITEQAQVFGITSASSPCLMLWLITDKTDNQSVIGTYVLEPNEAVWFGEWLYPVMVVIIVIICITVGCVMRKRRRRRRTANNQQ